MDNNTEKDYKLLYCPICGYSWMAKITGKKNTYYQCPACKHQNNIDKFEKQKDESLNTKK